MTSILSSILSFIAKPEPGLVEEDPLPIKAVPGLTTLLDVALFQSNEGQLTATICSSHALLACWLDVKHQSQALLEQLVHHEKDSSIKLLCESWARQCLDSSMDAIERLSTENFAHSANLTDPYESVSTSGTGNHGNTSLSGLGAQGVASGIINSKEETGRRTPLQRRKDCWESPRLFCPDHVWADDSYTACQRWIRHLAKHPFIAKETDSLSSLSSSPKDSGFSAKNLDALSSKSERESMLLTQLIQEDLPVRLHQFRQAMEAEAVVTKRLYLVKSEYRAPFRAFLEAHQTLLRAPPMGLVRAYLNKNVPIRKEDDPGTRFQELLKTPSLIEMLALERECEQLEVEIGQALFPFSEMCRSLDHKKARLAAVAGVLQGEALVTLQELVRRLKCILCRKAGPETSPGIRPILLDLKGVPRDDQVRIQQRSSSQEYATGSQLESRIDEFIAHLQSLSKLIKTKNAFVTFKNSSNSHNHNSHNDHIEFSVSIVKGCTESFDAELMKCQLMDWFEMVDRQHTLQQENESLPEQIRQAEMAMGVAGASEQSLKMVKERLEKMQMDRSQRLEVLKELLEDLCLREMHLYVSLTGPEPTDSLVLNETSAVGFLGVPLQIAGEVLPVG